QNTFWHVPHSDPANIFCFNSLHAGDNRLWGDHLFEELKGQLDILGREAQAMVDSQHATFPPWCNFNHSATVMNISFSNGIKLLDISK
ncbi:hypothetical protein PAXRUDRAFT_46552, partial [Paxillus rubicundulus Ve08.2h10]